MFAIHLRVTPDDGDAYVVVADSRDVYLWEKTTPNKSTTILQALEEIRFLEIYRLGWICCRRLGMFAGTLEQFTETMQIEPGEEEQEDDQEQPDPTRGGASPTSVSSSPSPPASPRKSGPKKAGAR
jgi:hypothetical protein